MGGQPSFGLVSTTIDQAIAERATFRLSLRIVDEQGVTLPALDTLTLRIFDAATGGLIRNVGNVLTSFSAGQFEWISQSDDARVIGNQRSEAHLALLEWSWDGGDRTGKHVIVHTVANLVGVPA